MTADQFRAESVDTLVDEYYAKRYSTVHATGCLGGAAKAMHASLERGRAQGTFPITLELGAGEFQHYRFVTHARRRYLAADIRVPTGLPFYQDLVRGAGPEDLRFVAADASCLPFADSSIDRVVASCLILHLDDPLAALREWQRVCRPGGTIDFLVPCEPGLALRAFRRLVSHRAAKAHGVSATDFDLVNALDHVSYFGRVLTVAQAAVDPSRRLDVRYYPFPGVASWNLNAFAVFSLTPRDSL